MCGDPTGDTTEPRAGSRSPERRCRPAQLCDLIVLTPSNSVTVCVGSRRRSQVPAVTPILSPSALRSRSVNNTPHRRATRDARAQGALTSVVRGSSSQRRGRTFGTKASHNPGGEGRTRK